MLGEPISPVTYYNALGDAYSYLNHRLKRSNIAYFDGHVQWFPVNNINYKAPTIPVPQGTACLVSVFTAGVFRRKKGADQQAGP